MITTTHKLGCTHCGKSEEKVELVPPLRNWEKSQDWYSLQLNHKHYQQPLLDFNIAKDFCSLECISAYINNRINPIVDVDIATGTVIRLKDNR